MPVIGYLHFGSPGPFAYQLVPFRQGLAQNGYVEGQNVAIETRWAEGHNDRLPALAADLVAREIDVIYAGGPPAAVAAKNATATSQLSSRSASTQSRPASSPVSRVRAALRCHRFSSRRPTK
jgi:putative ABC transport system substrate-binding protein